MPSYRVEVKMAGVSIQCLLNTNIDDNTISMNTCSLHAGQRAAMASSTNVQIHVSSPNAPARETSESISRWSQGGPCNDGTFSASVASLVPTDISSISVIVSCSVILLLCLQLVHGCRGSTDILLLAVDHQGAAAAARSEGMRRR